MHHHKRRPWGPIAVVAVAVLVAVATGALMMVNPPAPTQIIEKELDAKAFLAPKE